MSTAQRSSWSTAICVGVLLLFAPPPRLALGQPAGAPPRIATIEGQFGKAEVNVTAPSLTRLYLRGPSGLSEKSVLASTALAPWSTDAYTYVIGPDQRRYESRLAKPEKVDQSGEGRGLVVRMAGVKLVAAAGETPVATEDWTLSAPGDGSQLVWKITRRWQKDFTSTLSGSPGLFFCYGSPAVSPPVQNSVTSTIWYDPLRIDAGPSKLYSIMPFPRGVSENHLQVIKDRDTWAIYKLWTNWHAQTDLRLEVQGGHLYRRGSLALRGEAGAVTGRDAAQLYRKGQSEEIALNISAVDKQTTGYQMAVTVPDKAMETSLKDFYASVLNGGVINDQKSFAFGNQTDGWYYGGECWMNGLALSVGTPTPGRLSTHPYDVTSAFREHLAHILSTLDDQGWTHYGCNTGGAMVDEQLFIIIGAYAYLLHSGDLAFVKQQLPALERMLGYFIRYRNADGLYKTTPGVGWYYDALRTNGVNGCFNAYFYKGALDLADMEAAAGHQQKAREYRDLAASIRTAFNRVLWRENAPGGPRYADWIDDKGKDVTYFCDLCQWPPVAVGIASPEQARKLVATADARIAQLEKQYGYQGFAGLSALWPVPAELNPFDWQTYGRYMNGGCLLAQTYWEIMARIRAGDEKGATRRLKLFAGRAAENGWGAGDNAANIKGEMKGGDGEPYLADMVVVPAALIHGLLGVTPTWDGLKVTPHLPADWPRAESEILYKGRRHRISINGQQVKIEPLEQVIRQPLLWVMDFNLDTLPGGRSTTENVELREPYCDMIALKRIHDDQGALGLWKLDEPSGAVQDASPNKHHGTIGGETKNVRAGEPGHSPAGKSYHFDVNGGVIVPTDRSFVFDRSQSFTLQCWFKTKVAAGCSIMLAKVEAYNLCLKEGKLAALLMQDGGQVREARGSRLAADNQWHHAAAVFDRQTQRLSLYLDGKLDTADGAPGPSNPVDISPIGVSTSRMMGAIVIIASPGCGSPFVGWLDEVSIFHKALKPAEFCLQHDYPTPYGGPAVTYPASGSYLSPPYDWATAARLTDLTVAADLHGGQVTATVETSNDGFRTVASSTRIRVQDGANAYPLNSLRGSEQAVRVRLDLMRGPDAARTPVVDGFRITANPAN